MYTCFIRVPAYFWNKRNFKNDHFVQYQQMIDEEDPEKQKKLEIEMQRRDAKRNQRKTAKMKETGLFLDFYLNLNFTWLKPKLKHMKIRA